MSNREIVKRFVASRWNDEKIAHVYAFNEDGKMSFVNPCACLIGVDSSQVLHKWSWGCLLRRENHYHIARRNLIALEAERAYLALGDFHRKARRRIFGEILREIMAEREAVRQKCAEARELVSC